MKYDFKRMICLLLSVAMLFSLAACGGNGSTESVVDLGGDEEWGIEEDISSESETASEDEESAADDSSNADDSTESEETTSVEETTSSNKTSSNKTSSKETGSKETSSKETSSNKTSSNKTSSKKTSSKKTSSKDTNSKDNNNNVTTPTVKNPDSLDWKSLLAQIPSTLKGTTLKVYSWNPIKDVTGAEKVITDFEKQTGIKVEWTVGNYENYESEIAALINSGDSPDIIRYINPSVSRMYLTQDVKSATGYDFKGDIWDKNLTSAYSVNGKIYGVNLKNTFNQQPTVVTYSMSTIDRYKLDDPYTLWKEGEWNWDKFLEMCKEFKEETGRPAWMTSGHTEMLWFNNQNVVKFDGKKYINNISDSNLLKAYQDAANYRADGVVCEAMREHDKLEDGTYLFFTTNILAARRTDFHFPTLKANDDLYCVPVPEGVNSTYYQHFQEYEAYGIPKGAKNAASVYYFLRYYLNRENYDDDMFFVNNQTLETYDYCMSQKNTHYTMDAGASLGLETFIRTGGTAAQMKNKLDEVSPVLDQAIKVANATLDKF